MVGYAESIDAKRRVGRDGVLALDAAVGVSRLLLRNDRFPLGIMNHHRKRPTGELRAVLHVVLRVANPELVLHLLSRGDRRAGR